MKKTIVLLVTVAIILSSCENEVDQPNENLELQEESLKPADKKNLVVQKLLQSGTNYDDILEGEKFFYVKDLLFTKNIEDYEFSDNNDSIIQSKQYREAGIVSLFNLRITVYLEPSLRGVYLNDLLQAINRYNNVAECGLFMEYSTSTASTIVIEPTFSSDEFWGRAQFPTKSRPGKQVYINTRINGTTQSADARMELFIHEIGHCIGLRHTDWRSNDEGSYGSFWDFWGVRPDSPIHIPGTPTDERDTDSVMWSQVDTGFVGFSNFDVIALQTLYPHAYRFRTVLNYRDYYPDGEKDISEDVFVDIFEDASYTSPLILTNSSSVRYYKVTRRYNASSGTSCSPRTRTLTPGNSSYFLEEVREQCSPYQGEVCTEEYLSASTCN